MKRNKIILLFLGLTFCVSTFYFSINTYTNEYSETHYLFMEDTGINKSNLSVSEASLQELSIGDDNAPITIIEYASMTCSHCADFHTETYPDLKEDYIEKGQVKFIFREFPLDKLSMATSMLARCVDNSISLAFIDILFQNRNKWYSDNAITELKNLSKQAGLSSEDFDQCLNNQGLLDQLIMQKENAVKEFQINSTPSFIINGKVISGNKPYSYFKSEIEKILDLHKGI
tara:strand:- start:175 stop:864 length:690 start_codon:yes stop_codon:yes gene_type:complete